MLCCAAVLGTMAYGSAAIGSGVYVRALCRGRTREKVAALTFDDGPDPVQTPKILEILARENIKAAFFCTGQQAEYYPEIVAGIAAQGHIVGNHTYSHSPRFPFMKRAAARKELAECGKILEAITGERTVWFRPPFGVTNPEIAAAVRTMKYRVMGWSVRSFDTRMRPHGKTVRRILRKLHPGAIVLLHDTLPGSDRLLETVIAAIRSRGYGFERPDRLPGVK